MGNDLRFALASPVCWTIEDDADDAQTRSAEGLTAKRALQNESLAMCEDLCREVLSFVIRNVA